jgi:hypothetical protein
MFRLRLRRRSIIATVQADKDYMGLCVCVGFQSLIFNGVKYFEQKFQRMLNHIVLKTNLMSVNQLAVFIV